MDYEFVRGQFTEAQLEAAIIEIFQQQGYIYVHGEKIHRQYEDILLEDDLRSFLQERYAHEGLSETETQKIINQLTLIPASPLYEGNRVAFWLVNEGFDLQRDDLSKVALHIDYIDFDHLENNIFKVVNQYSVQGERLRRPDLLVFINGIPVAIFEFKSAINEDVNHQLIYKNYGDGCDFHVTMPKTEAGIREIPMSKMVAKAFETQRRLNFQMGIPRDVKIEGLSNFVFMSRSGRPMMPTTVNFILRDIVKAYNEEENEWAKRERRKPEELPHISAHILRHTACTRMAETDLDMKVVQYVMGHANISVTMEVYNHITDRSRIEKEIAKMDLVQIM